jgi:hypothetical protein
MIIYIKLNAAGKATITPSHLAKGMLWRTPLYVGLAFASTRESPRDKANDASCTRPPSESTYFITGEIGGDVPIIVEAYL